MNQTLRSRQLELLDGENLDFDEYRETLRQLELINSLTGGHGLTLRGLDLVSSRYPGKTLRILDIGFGFGGALRAAHQWAVEKGVNVELTGVDLNPWAKEVAEEETPKEFGVRFLVGNALTFSGDGEFDVIINSLFMHHLDDEEIVDMIRWMTNRARLSWFINDLHRHPLAFHFIKICTRAFGFNRVIRNDAPLSVARSLSRNEWMDLIRVSGVPSESIRIRWYWSFRYGIFCDVRTAEELRDV